MFVTNSNYRIWPHCDSQTVEMYLLIHEDDDDNCDIDEYNVMLLFLRSLDLEHNQLMLNHQRLL